MAKSIKVENIIKFKIMQKEKGFSSLIGIVIIVAVAVVAVGGIFGYQYLSELKESANINNDQSIVGGDKDEHGCIGSAGYSWCEAKQKCLRTWEEPCEVTVVDQTAGWKTYKNDKMGFEIKYPTNFSKSANLGYQDATDSKMVETGTKLSSLDTFNYGSDAVKMGITGIQAQTTNPRYNISVNADRGAPIYSTTIAPWVDPILCEKIKPDLLMPLSLKKVQFGNYNFCIIDKTETFLKIARSTKNNPGELSMLVNQGGPGIDYVVLISDNQFFRISFYNYDYGYQIAKIILNGGNIENGIKNMETDIVAREQIVKQILSTFKFTPTE